MSRDEIETAARLVEASRCASDIWCDIKKFSQEEGAPLNISICILRDKDGDVLCEWELSIEAAEKIFCMATQAAGIALEEMGVRN